MNCVTFDIIILCSDQHGFCKNHSSEAQFLKTVYGLTLSDPLNASKQTDPELLKLLTKFPIIVYYAN